MATRVSQQIASARPQHIALAKQLPPRLLDFFKKYPPPQISTAPTITAASSQSVEIAENTSSSGPSISATTTEVTPPAAQIIPRRKPSPFQAWKNPRTGAWHGPAYSLRRQAEMFKLAKKHNVLPLMPLSPKHPDVKERKRIEHGLRVQGTGEGKRVKGKAWERTLSTRLEVRRKAMEGMPHLIRKWRASGHGKGWKAWPK